MTKKLDYFYILLIIFITIYMFTIFGNNIYSPYSDIGREFYIPQQINNGEVLYKDIFNVYSPLGYWLTALITKLFNNNIQTFLNIGLISSILTVIPIYLITKNYTNKHIALITTIDLIIVCTFCPTISNWITPYSYSIVFALCAILWATFYLIKFIDTHTNKYYIIAGFLTGLSLCFKYEYIGFLLILLLVGYTAKIEKRTIFNTILSLFSMPVLCLITLFLQGCTLYDLTNALENIIKLSRSESVSYFYKYAGIQPSLNATGNVFPITYICIILFIIKLIKKDYKLSILILTSLLFSIKTIGGISFEIYGTYFYPLLFISIVAFVYDKPNIIKSIFISIFCIILCITNFNANITKSNALTELETPKGIIRIPIVFKETTIDLLNYLQQNTTENDKIIIFAEGSLINYITNNKSDNYLYYLIPPNDEVFNKDIILKRINNKDINYIICSNLQYPWYNEKSFLTGWGKKYIDKLEYKEKEIIGKNFQFTIYKR